jgi:hypothetical protein
VTRRIFRLLPPPGCPTGTVIAPGDMRGYRRVGRSGLRVVQVFFAAGIVARRGQKMPRRPAARAVPRAAAQAVQLAPDFLRSRQGFTSEWSPCEAVTSVRPVPSQLDSEGTTVRLRRWIWWPAERSFVRRANRELRCDSGTAPPLYPDVPERSETGWPLSKPLRLLPPAGLPREGDGPPASGSQKTYQLP